MNQPEDLSGRWYDLKERAIFRLTGADRVRYLNGQVSNDVSKANGGRTIPACLCTIKGKVEALIWIHADGEAIYVDGELRQREFLRARLERYLIADDCEIDDLSEEIRVIHHFCEGMAGFASPRLRIPGADVFLGSSEKIPLPEERRITEEEWKLFETLSIVPRSEDEINGDEFPAELGLDDWAVDFHKGCYLGQEIISRIRSVGKVKRCLRLVESPNPLRAGDELKGKSGETGIVTRASSPLGEKKHMTLALTALASGESKRLVNQRVKSIGGNSPTRNNEP